MDNIKWFDKEILKMTEGDVKEGMKKAMRYAVRECKQLISRGNVTGLNPSLPGEPPKRVTGVLVGSIDYEVGGDKLTGIYGRFGVKRGVAEDYGLELEMGTSKMAPRPYLRRTFHGLKELMFQLILLGGRGRVKAFKISVE